MYLYTWSPASGTDWNDCGTSETCLVEVGYPGHASEGLIPSPSLVSSLRSTEISGALPACVDCEICHVFLAMVVVDSQTVSQNESSLSVQLLLSGIWSQQ